MNVAENELKKEYLWRYRDIKEEMHRAELTYKELRLSFYPSGGGNTSGSRHELNDLSETVMLIEAAEKRYLKKRYQRIKILTEIEDSIARLDKPKERDVLTHRYILLQKWEDICNELDMSWKQVHRVHSSALHNFEIPAAAQKNLKNFQNDIE